MTETIHVFESTARHGFGIVFVKAETPEAAIEELNEWPEHRGEDFDYLGTHDEWAESFRDSEATVYSEIYYR